MKDEDRVPEGGLPSQQRTRSQNAMDSNVTLDSRVQAGLRLPELPFLPTGYSAPQGSLSQPNFGPPFLFLSKSGLSSSSANEGSGDGVPREDSHLSKGIAARWKGIQTL